MKKEQKRKNENWTDIYMDGHVMLCDMHEPGIPLFGHTWVLFTSVNIDLKKKEYLTHK